MRGVGRVISYTQNCVLGSFSLDGRNWMLGKHLLGLDSVHM